MSRTDKEAPHRFQQDAPRLCGKTCGGIWNGIHYWANLRERQARRQAKRALQRGEEPHPYKGKNSTQWDMY